MLTKAEIAKSTPSSNGGFINTVLLETVVKSGFGTKKVTQKVFYKSDEALTVGDVLEIDITQFKFTEVRGVYVDTATGEERIGAMTYIKEKGVIDNVGNVSVIDNVPAKTNVF
jgi:hypothetical protein